MSLKATQGTCTRCNSRIQPISLTQWSDLKAHLRGNHHPSSSPAAHVPQHLKEAEAGLIRYDAEIKRQRSIIVSLQNEQKLLRRQVEEYKSLLSPIRKLPLEILRLVFTHVCGENVVGLGGYPIIPALVLGEVCAYWRTVSLSAQELWSTIDVLVPSGEAVGSEQTKAVSVLRKLLERSGHMPLTISITEGPVTVPQPITKVLDLLLLHSYRWYSLELNHPCRETSLYFPSIRGRLPLLEVLHIGTLAHEDECAMFEIAPKLHTVILTNDIDRIPILPWSQIRNLEMGYLCCDFAKGLR